MNITFDIFIQLEPIWLFFFFVMFFFFSIFYIFRSYYDKLFFYFRSDSKRFVNVYYKNSNVDFGQLNLFCLRFLILLILIFFFLFNYIYLYSTDQLFYYFQVFNYCWVYGNLIIFIFLTYLIVLYLTFHNTIIKNTEHLFGVIFLFLNLYYYIFVNNFIAIIFLFELQSIVLLYFIAVCYQMYFNLNNKHELKSLNFQWYVNSLFFQFWISFIGVIFLMYGIFYIFKFTSFFNWSNVEIFFFFYKYSWNFVSFFDFLMIWIIFFIGLLLKIGFFPFFLWKPELYKSLSVYILFFYMYVYLFFILLFIFFFFNSYLYLIKDLWYIYIYYIYTIAIIFLLFYLYSIQDIRSFLAYSSALNLCYLLIILTLQDFFSSAIFIFYLLTYMFYVFNFFIFLFLITNNFLWFFTDLQLLSNNLSLLIFFFCIFFGMAGIPPFLGFYAKLKIILLLLNNDTIFFFFITLFSGLFSAFFYLQVYRFSGFSFTRVQYVHCTFIPKFSYNLYIINYLFLFINIFSYFFISDIWSFAMWLSLSI